MVIYANISPKMDNPRDLAGIAVELTTNIMCVKYASKNLYTTGLTNVNQLQCLALLMN